MNKKQKKTLIYIGLYILAFFSGNNFMEVYVNKRFSSSGFVVSLLFFFSYCFFLYRYLDRKDKK